MHDTTTRCDPAAGVPDAIRRGHLQALCRRWLEFAVENIDNAEEEAGALRNRAAEGTLDHTVARAVLLRCGVAREQLAAALGVLKGE